MNVREAIKLLQQCDPDALLVANLPFQGIEEITTLERKSQGGVGFRMSFDEVAVVELSNGSPTHMTSQGFDVLGVPDVGPPNTIGVHIVILKSESGDEYLLGPWVEPPTHKQVVEAFTSHSPEEAEYCEELGFQYKYYTLGDTPDVVLLGSAGTTCV